MHDINKMQNKRQNPTTEGKSYHIAENGKSWRFKDGKLHPRCYIMASRKLCHYFQAHEITVVTRFPLQRILQNPEATSRIVEWALELSSFGLKFESTSTIQSRALAEFIAECTPATS